MLGQSQKNWLCFLHRFWYIYLIINVMMWGTNQELYKVTYMTCTKLVDFRIFRGKLELIFFLNENVGYHTTFTSRIPSVCPKGLLLFLIESIMYCICGKRDWSGEKWEKKGGKILQRFSLSISLSWFSSVYRANHYLFTSWRCSTIGV